MNTEYYVLIDWVGGPDGKIFGLRSGSSKKMFPITSTRTALIRDLSLMVFQGNCARGRTGHMIMTSINHIWEKQRFSGEKKADYMRSWKDNVDRKLIEWTGFSFQDIFKSNRSIYSFASESFWRSILWMLRLNFTLGIWRISLDRLFQTLTPFLEKDMFCFSNLEYSRKKLPLVDDLVLWEWILCW